MSTRPIYMVFRPDELKQLKSAMGSAGLICVQCFGLILLLDELSRIHGQTFHTDPNGRAVCNDCAAKHNANKESI